MFGSLETPPAPGEAVELRNLQTSLQPRGEYIWEGLHRGGGRRSRVLEQRKDQNQKEMGMDPRQTRGPGRALEAKGAL